MLWGSGAEPTIELDYEAPPQCPSAAEVQGRLDSALASDPSPGRASGRAHARIEAAADGGFVLALTLELERASTRRVLRADECDALADAVATIVAVASAEFAAPTSSQPTAKDTPAPPRSRPARTDEGLLRATTGVDFGILPGPSATIGVAVGWARRGVRVEAGLRYGFRSERRYPRTDVGGAFTSLVAHVRGCGVPEVRRFAFPICMGPTVGAVRGRGLGVSEPKTTWDPAIGLEAAVAMRWRATRWLGLWLGASGFVALRRPAFALRERDLLYRAPAGGFGAQGGLEISWGGPTE